MQLYQVLRTLIRTLQESVTCSSRTNRTPVIFAAQMFIRLAKY